MSLVNAAIEKTISSKGNTFCKFLTANDSGETGGHQSGYLISNSALKMFFTKPREELDKVSKQIIKVKWHNDFETESCITWYESKKELRITKLGKGFSFRGAEYTGALFVLIKVSESDYEGYIFEQEEDIDSYLDCFGLTPVDLNRMVYNDLTFEGREKLVLGEYAKNFGGNFPSSVEMSKAARMIYDAVSVAKVDSVKRPDDALVGWVREEYNLFQALENELYSCVLKQGFRTVDEFVELANKVLNRRKSRAGKSLEHHLAALFLNNEVKFAEQVVTEGNKKPDFIFPSGEAYHDLTFPTYKLTMLAAKTTCKDRWRQILNEADRLKDDKKYLCTLQQGISVAQMNEMRDEGVVLVVPKPHISAYSKEVQDRIWTVQKFISYVKERELLT